MNNGTYVNWSGLRMMPKMGIAQLSIFVIVMRTETTSFTESEVATKFVKEHTFSRILLPVLAKVAKPS